MNFTMSDNRTPLNPGDVIEVNAHKKFVIDKYVACGGFALMYIAHEENAGGSRYVALKELFPRNPDNALVQRMEDGKILIWNPFAIDSASGDEEVLEALKQYFVREVELTQKAGVVYASNGQVEQQNNLDVLNVEGPFTDTKGNVYLAVDTYMGESLREFIERGFVKDSDGKVHSNQFLLEIIDILIETTLRLSSLHDMASMYHLDLSPDNIYLAQVAGRTRHQPYIIDYGSAYDRDNPDEQVDHRYTWNSFSAPEVIKLAELKSGYELFVDESSDTFSIASILFYAATGSTFTSEMRFYDDQWQEQIRQAYSLGIPSFSRELSFANDLIAFFKHGLAVNQNDRYRSAKELLCALQQIKASYQSYGNLLPLVERDELMSYLVLQKHPLYEYKGDDGNIHVLCLGSGCFIKRMILSLISTGQMIGSHLYIHIVSKEANSALRAELCADAPLLQEYSNLMGACNPQNEYVTFSFEAVENVLQEDSCRAIVEKYSLAHYYLISLGKNRQNTDAANLYAKTISESHVCKRKTIINFYCSEDAANSGLTLSGTPSFSSNDVKTTQAEIGALLIKGERAEQEQHYEKALLNYQTALQTIERLGDARSAISNLDLADLYDRIAVCYEATQNFSVAKEHYTKAALVSVQEAMEAESPDAFSAAIIYVQKLISFSAEFGNLDEAEKHRQFRAFLEGQKAELTNKSNAAVLNANDARDSFVHDAEISHTDPHVIEAKFDEFFGISNEDDFDIIEEARDIEARFDELFGCDDNPHLNPEDPWLMTLTDENGQNEIFRFVDVIAFESDEYVCLVPVDGDKVVIFRVVANEEDGLDYLPVEDEDLLTHLFEMFKEKNKNNFNFVD